MNNTKIQYQNVGVVAIGRNEGERLKRCLTSVVGQVSQVIYVDSGSTDDSINTARELEVFVVELDMTKPFTAARARNTGFQHLLKLKPDLKYVQFVDGDCEIESGWINDAVTFLKENTKIAVVCGRRRERYPENSIYNQLCDIEWNTPIGETKSCGGDAMIHVDAFKSVNGFRDDLIAGEEPELCVRIRQAGWKIWRIESEMTLHDANITHFYQWWKRSIRGGYAFAEGAYLHGKPPERHWVRESQRIWLWGVFFPVGALLLSSYSVWFLFLFLVYPIKVFKLAMRGRLSSKVNWLYSFYMMVIKFPEVYGQLKFLLNRITRSKSSLIEYK